MHSEPAWARQQRLDREAEDEARAADRAAALLGLDVTRSDCAWCHAKVEAGCLLLIDGALVCQACAERGHPARGDWE